LPDGSLLVVGMGGWKEKHGSLWHLQPNAEGREFSKARLATGLDRPHGIAMGPDGFVYLAAAQRILRISLDSSGKVQLQTFIGGDSGWPDLPSRGLHPLKNLVFDQRGDLFIAIGSATDHCPNTNDADLCAEALGDEPLASVRRYRIDWSQPDRPRVLGWSTHARGLRNSLAIAYDRQSDSLWAADNGRDRISAQAPDLDDAALPNEELNRIVDGGHYGWPWCYGANAVDPAHSGHDCKAYRTPEALLPAHAAPLGMAIAAAKSPADLSGQLVMAWHGYRATGHRIVAFTRISDGSFGPTYRELVWGWDASVSGPMGAPVDIRQGADGTFWITEDRNGTVVRLARED
jgi:glucose/arabinose dehydrogenase